MGGMKQARKSLGLTQKALAELTRTSQQQIQRLETGASTPTLPMASAIAAALRKPIEELFPASLGVVNAVRERIRETNVIADEDLDEAAAAGIELDPYPWHVRLFVEGHPKPLVIEVESTEERRLMGALMEAEKPGFVEFLVVYGKRQVAAFNKKYIMHMDFVESLDSSQRKDIGAEELLPLGSEVLFEFIDNREVSVPVASMLRASEHDETSQLLEILGELESGANAVGDRFFFMDDYADLCVVRPESLRIIHVPYGLVHLVDED